MQDDIKRQKLFAFAIEHLSDDAFLGSLAVHDIDWIARTGRLGIVIHKPENRGKGYGTEAMELLIDFCWKHINLRKLELGVHSFNERAKKVYLKLDFVEYGTAHQQFYIDGEYVDSVTWRYSDQILRIDKDVGTDRNEPRLRTQIGI